MSPGTHADLALHWHPPDAPHCFFFESEPARENLISLSVLQGLVARRANGGGADDVALSVLRFCGGKAGYGSKINKPWRRDGSRSASRGRVFLGRRSDA